MTNLIKKQILVLIAMQVSGLAMAVVPGSANVNGFASGAQQQQSMPLGAGFVAPQPQRVQEVPAYASGGGNGCTTYRNDNTRIQNGQLVPAQQGIAH